MKVLVTFAVETEFAPCKKALSLRASVRDGLAIHSCAIGGADVDFVVTGMGAESASRCAEILLRDRHDAVIAAGFAGALRPNLNVADVIVAAAVQQLGKPQTLVSDGSLVSIASASGAKIIETLLSVDQIAGTAEEKARLAPIANAADMESFAILSAARAHRIPAVAIRAISDSSEQDLPAGVDALVDDDGRIDVSGVVKYVTGHPLAVPAVIRLGRRSKSAAENLTRFLESYIRNLTLAAVAGAPEELQGVIAR
jgi:adenosylhomocysteine nucleosidase